MQTVEITVSGGVVQYVEFPRGVRVIVRDYDVEGTDESNSHFDIRRDERDDLFEQSEYIHDEDKQLKPEEPPNQSAENETKNAETHQAPVYMELFHGRKDPNQEMDDWGEPGPILECQYVHTTYSHDIKIGDNSPAELLIRHGMIYYGGLWYGDWSVFVPSGEFRESEEFQRRLQPFDPEKVKLPKTDADQEQHRSGCNIPVDVSKVDWALLRKQKEALIAAAGVTSKRQPLATIKKVDADAFEGLLNLLDHIQDSAATVLGEKAVFGLLQETTLP
jgi:hypothetical protein